MINSVAIMKPKTTLLGVVPVSFKIFKPILLCKFTSSKAKASTKSPKNKKIIVLPKLAPTSAIFITFKNGKRIKANNAVTAIFTVSVTHQRTIQMATAITASAFAETSVSGEN